MMVPTCSSPSYRRNAALAVALGASLLASAASTAAAQVRQAGAPELSAELASVRDALDRYRDPLVAVREGYFSTLSCIEFPQGGVDGTVQFKPGAMGVHLLNMGNVGPVLDPAKPQVLIYEPHGDSLRLVAAEWFVPAAMVTDGKAPRVLGRDLIGPMAGHEPIMPAELRHYDLHVWLWRSNPNGTFEPTNPNVTCPQSGYTHAQPAAAHKH